MAKLVRKHQKVFAGDVSPTNVVAKFGSYAASAPSYSSDPDVIQELAAYGSGWGSALVNNYTPALQDMNALFFLITRQLAYLFQAGVPEWSATETYYIGSTVNDGSGNIFASLADNNINNALTDGTKWIPVFNRKITVTGTLSSMYQALATDWLIVMNPTNLDTFGLPLASTCPGREYIVKNAQSSYGSVAVFAWNGSSYGGAIDGETGGVYMDPLTSKRFISNGTTWSIVS